MGWALPLKRGPTPKADEERSLLITVTGDTWLGQSESQMPQATPCTDTPSSLILMSTLGWGLPRLRPSVLVFSPGYSHTVLSPWVSQLPPESCLSLL